MDRPSLLAAYEAKTIVVHVLEATTEDLTRRGALHPDLIRRIAWTAALSEDERRTFVGEVLDLQMSLTSGERPTRLIDAVGWWKATALGRGASVAGMLQLDREAYRAARTPKRKRGDPARGRVR